MLFRFLFCLTTTWWSAPAVGATVAFLELHWQDGQRVQLEPGGRFAHVAIKVGRKWLHAHTERGVDIVRNITHYGNNVVYLENDQYESPTQWSVQTWMGKPFDTAYRWGVVNATYCTRLVAELLHIPPRPMQFRSEVWDRMSSAPRGELGLSPDELYEELIKRGFKPVKTCARALIDG
ncbi:MAG: hypothetical protein KF799_14405 [Bdellovibrionales bacterium]|nr:hypothetical protein [Bdellovibrionales bacterium]